MTLPELFDSSPDVWEKMNDAELLEVFKESLTQTRPELAVRAERKQDDTASKVVMADPKKAAQLAALAAAGVDMSFMDFKKKKR